MHIIQEKILKLIDGENISDLVLRDIAKKIGETGSPQKIKHHLDQLASKGFIKIDKRAGKIERIKSGLKKGSNFISLPILGSANCGQAAFFADDHVEGYLKVTKGILGDLIDKVKDLFVLRAVGQSMNQANVAGRTIEDGDYVIVDKKHTDPVDGDFVVSVIDGVANIKKIFIDKDNKQIVLLSQSNQNIAPIYIHKNDMDDYLIAGTVVQVMKQPDELASFRDAAALDTLNELGPISKKEYDYYQNLCLKGEK